MVERLIESIASLRLISPNDRLLVGVSGGIDSVVLVDLLLKARFNFAVAHCNFKLRGEESDKDEAFVKKLAEKCKVTYFVQSFDTRRIASHAGVSIEMAARDLRYAWFEKIRLQHHFDWIFIAHHRDDQAETFFLNLARGTGISGLTGMSAINGKVVRPLLFSSRKEIESYAAENNITYHEDETNAQTEFHRNKIRHLVIPMMEEINPAFRKGLIDTLHHLHDTFLIYNQSVDRAIAHVVRCNTRGEIELLLAELRLLDPLTSYLFEILKPYHFNGDVVEEIVNSLNGQPGKQFFSATHRAFLDREVIIIQKLPQASFDQFYLEEDCSNLTLPLKLTISTSKRLDNLCLKTSTKTALIDRDKLQFPLILRKWQLGDFFQPLGMQGMKKLSDFFIDEKFSLSDKENVWLLTNGVEIVWIVGVRLDERYKITPETRSVLTITLD